MERRKRCCCCQRVCIYHLPSNAIRVAAHSEPGETKRKVSDMSKSLSRRNIFDPFDMFDGVPFGLMCPVSGFKSGLAKATDDSFARLRCDVAETDEGYEVKADMPGADKENISVSFDDGMLTVSYKHDEEKTDGDEDGKWKIRERSMSSCRRSIAMPDADADSIKASMDNGVLTITAGKVEKAETKKEIAID